VLTHNVHTLQCRTALVLEATVKEVVGLQLNAFESIYSGNEIHNAIIARSSMYQCYDIFVLALLYHGQEVWWCADTMYAHAISYTTEGAAANNATAAIRIVLNGRVLSLPNCHGLGKGTTVCSIEAFYAATGTLAAIFTL
jgi:hypothetical protein